MPWRTRYKENSPPLHIFIRWNGGTKERRKALKRTNAYIRERTHTHMRPPKRKSCLFVSFARSLFHRWYLWRHLRSRKTIIITHPMHLNSCLASAPLSSNQQLIMYDWWKKWSETAQLFPRRNERAVRYTSDSLSHTHPNWRHVCARIARIGLSIYI